MNHSHSASTIKTLCSEILPLGNPSLQSMLLAFPGRSAAERNYTPPGCGWMQDFHLWSDSLSTVEMCTSWKKMSINQACQADTTRTI